MMTDAGTANNVMMLEDLWDGLHHEVQRQTQHTDRSNILESTEWLYSSPDLATNVPGNVGASVPLKYLESREWLYSSQDLATSVPGNDVWASVPLKGAVTVRRW